MQTKSYNGIWTMYSNCNDQNFRLWTLVPIMSSPIVVRFLIISASPPTVVMQFTYKSYWSSPNAGPFQWHHSSAIIVSTINTWQLCRRSREGAHSTIPEKELTQWICGYIRLRCPIKIMCILSVCVCAISVCGGWRKIVISVF